ncbi:hypothetical protein TGAM01_v207757 [Trichoderma gamsii]|uniref:Uncharacterized protein n=1 Tax=Trichoderma gamsii TaxID=398673 RepID=A0A2P4ZGW7_9HYPO|nr:hypothetical protein TGAM01_v207757 [Trichoderma gamsii]PON23523.1 hypothetical protein TGAM01_v207757 [Trichoderma gamsii]
MVYCCGQGMEGSRSQQEAGCSFVLSAGAGATALAMKPAASTKRREGRRLGFQSKHYRHSIQHSLALSFNQRYLQTCTMWLC